MNVGKFFKKKHTEREENPNIQMLAKIYFKLDNFKEVSKRSSVEILDFLGDIGGFMGALEMIFVIFGSYFSGKFMLAQLAQDMFLTKKKYSQQNDSGNDDKSIKHEKREIQKLHDTPN